MEQTALRIGEVAVRSEVSIDSVRYYEKRKLLPRASRSGNGYRLFPADTVERIKFIKQAQEMGFSLMEIRQLFSTDDEINQCRSVHDFLLRKLCELDGRIRQMKNFRTILNRHLHACEKELKAGGENTVCPVMIMIEKS